MNYMYMFFFKYLIIDVSKDSFTMIWTVYDCYFNIASSTKMLFHKFNAVHSYFLIS